MGDSVQFNDVLLAMSQSLMEKQPLPYVDTLVYQDHEIKYKIGGKPPREIFYRQTLTFITKLPPAVQEKMCTCRYVCFNSASTSSSAASRAVIKCHSCAIYDPKGIAYFCQECFDAYHPWYRTGHIFSNIAKDENIQHTLKVAHRVAEAVRYGMEGSIMMDKLQEEKERLNFIGDDAGIDRDMRVFGRRAVALEAEIARLRQINRKDIQHKHPDIVLPRIKEEEQQLLIDTSGNPNSISASEEVLSVPLIKESGEVVIVSRRPSNSVTFNNNSTENNENNSPNSHNDSRSKLTHLVSNASSSLQELSKSHRTESNVSQYTNFTIDSNDLTYSDDSDNEDGRTINTTDSSYRKYDKLTSFNSLSNMNLSANQRNEVRVNDVTSAVEKKEKKEEGAMSEVSRQQRSACVKIQSVFKGHMARRIVSVMMLQRIIKVWSPEAGTDFYYDRVTGSSTWDPPKLLLAKDLDDLPYSMEAVQVVKWCCKIHCDRRRPAPKITNRSVAALIIQQFGRCVMARNRVIRVADARYRRILDDSSGTYYYANILTGETSWYKLKLYLNRFPPIILHKDIEALVSGRSQKSNNNSKKYASSSSSKKRNPKLNRLI